MCKLIGLTRAKIRVRFYSICYNYQKYWVTLITFAWSQFFHDSRLRMLMNVERKDRKNRNHIRILGQERKFRLGRLDWRDQSRNELMIRTRILIQQFNWFADFILCRSIDFLVVSFLQCFRPRHVASNIIHIKYYTYESLERRIDQLSIFSTLLLKWLYIELLKKTNITFIRSSIA